MGLRRRVHERVSTNKLCKSRKGSFNTQFQQAIPSVSPRECDQGLQKGHALQIHRNWQGMWQTEVEEEGINTVQTFLSAKYIHGRQVEVDLISAVRIHRLSLLLVPTLIYPR